MLGGEICVKTPFKIKYCCATAMSTPTRYILQNIISHKHNYFNFDNMIQPSIVAPVYATKYDCMGQQQKTTHDHEEFWKCHMRSKSAQCAQAVLQL